MRYTMVMDFAMRRFRDLEHQSLRLHAGLAALPDYEHERVWRALHLARWAHQGQRRDEGDPYIIHPIRAANTLLYELERRDPDMLTGMLLHDVVEDASVPLREIEREFGYTPAYYVDELTRRKQAESKYDKVQRTMVGDPRIRILKASDALDNMRSLPLRSDRGPRWERNVREAADVYLPLAESTGHSLLMKEMRRAWERVPDRFEPSVLSMS